MDFTLRSAFKANSLLTKVVPMKFATRWRLCSVLCEKIKQAENLSEHQDGGHTNTGITEI
jgi:hypothetical protein